MTLDHAWDRCDDLAGRPTEIAIGYRPTIQYPERHQQKPRRKPDSGLNRDGVPWRIRERSGRSLDDHARYGGWTRGVWNLEGRRRRALPCILERKSETHEMAVRTERLYLVPAGLEHLNAELEGPRALSQLLGADVPESWPPGEYDHDALVFFRETLSAQPEAAGWLAWYVLVGHGEGRGGSVIGGAGFLGPPGPEATVEIGYSFVPEARGQGYAAEAVQALVQFAFGSGRVSRVIAHTGDDNLASSAVLRRCGFDRVGPGEQSGTTRYEIARELGA